MVKKSKTIVMPKKYEKAKPKVYEPEESDKEEDDDEEDEEEKPIKVPAIVQRQVRRPLTNSRQLTAHHLNHMQPPISVSHHT